MVKMPRTIRAAVAIDLTNRPFISVDTYLSKKLPWSDPGNKVFTALQGYSRKDVLIVLCYNITVFIVSAHRLTKIILLTLIATL